MNFLHLKVTEGKEVEYSEKLWETRRKNSFEENNAQEERTRKRKAISD
jgi:hypothetical protein